jgi:tetratricopeptide (TPR) repeat protein
MNNVKTWLIIFSLLIFSACQNDSTRDSKRLNEDKQTLAELNKIAASIQSGQMPNQEVVNSIKKIREKYPNAVEARNTYLLALNKREDWATAEKLLSEIPEKEKTENDKLNLANIYYKLGRYEEIVDLIKPLSATKPSDVNLNTLLGTSLFHLGKYDEAGQYFDKVTESLTANKRFEELTMRGTIYFHQGNYTKSIEVLKKSLEINPEHIPTINALSRAYTASGDLAQAESFREKTRTAYEKYTQSAQQKMKSVPLYYQLEDAWKAKKYDEVINVANQILPNADNNTKITLYQYLAQANQALGKQTEAQAAMLEIQKLQKK